MPVELLLEYLRSHYFGKYRGTVVDNDDETKRGRLQVSVKAVLGDLRPWAMPCVPYAGPGVGLCSLPPKGAGVWVEFEGGDPSYPIWTGCFWADGELPADAGPDVKVWKTASLTLKLDDAADELHLENGSESKTTYGSDVTTESGGASLAVGSGGVASESGAGKLQVGPDSVSVNGGALEVR